MTKIDESLAFDIGSDVEQMLWNNVFIISDKYQHEKIKTESGVTLLQDIDLGQDHHDSVSQSGVVKHVCKKHNKGYDIKLKPGDEVYTHHSLCADNRKTIINGELLYRMDYESCYLYKRDGQIHMLEDWVLVEPVKDHEIKGSIWIYNPNSEEKWMVGQGKLAHINDQLKDLGLSVGDTVYYENFADYRIRVDNELYFRMPNKLIFAAIKNGKVVPIGKWNFLSEPIVETEVKSDVILIPIEEEDKLKSKKGIVKYPSTYLESLGIKEGDAIVYSACQDSVEIEGKKLYRVSNEYVEAKIEE